MVFEVTQNSMLGIIFLSDLLVCHERELRINNDIFVIVFDLKVIEVIELNYGDEFWI